jgi:hypothetical protein
MKKSVRRNPVDLQSFPPALLSFALHEASKDADAVVHFLSMVEQRSGERWKRPVRFPASFLLGLAATLRMAGWEMQNLFPHTAEGLPQSSEALRQVAACCLDLHPNQRDQLVLNLCLQVFNISVTRFAWEGPAIFGGNVFLQNDEDEDQLISAIAELAWKHRHKEPNHVDATG